jgi:hypothetical protein
LPIFGVHDRQVGIASQYFLCLVLREVAKA